MGGGGGGGWIGVVDGPTGGGESDIVGKSKVPQDQTPPTVSVTVTSGASWYKSCKGRFSTFAYGKQSMEIPITESVGRKTPSLIACLRNDFQRCEQSKTNLPLEEKWP